MKSSLLLFAPLLALAVAQSGCLKTRAQLKQEPSESADDNAAANPVQNVPPTASAAGRDSYAVDELKAEIARLTGRIDELERDKKGDNTSTSVKALETRIAELEKAQADLIEAFKKSEAKAPAPTNLLAAAREKFVAKDYDGSIELLNEYLAHAKGKSSEDATFLRAEAFYLSHQYKKAIADYSKFPETFSKSRRMPQALYKIGLSFDNLGMKSDGQPFYQELIEKFPNSPEASKARARRKQ
jgi:TolA-binding protein